MILLGIAVVLTVGKYLFLACLYAFVLVVFRGMMRQLASEQGTAERPRMGQTARVSGGQPPPLAQAGPPTAQRVTQPALSSLPRAGTPAVQQVQPPAGPRLVVLESHEGNPPVGAEYPLTAAVTIGRDEENAIALADRYASGRHALICLREGRRILVDRGSTNGTLVNGRRVDAEIELADADRIAIGRTVFKYHAS